MVTLKRISQSRHSVHRTHLRIQFATVFILAILYPSLAVASSSAVTYSSPSLTDTSVAQLRKYYKWRTKMDWLLAPIHTRRDLKEYLKSTAKTGSPLDALSPDARQRFLSSMQFGAYGAGRFNFSDLQYLSTKQVYKILALFGEQGMTIEVTDGRIRPRSPHAKSGSTRASPIQQRFDKYWRAVQATFGKGWGKRSQVAGRMYDQLFASKQNSDFVTKVGNGDLRLLFRAACLAAFYTLDTRYAKDAHMDFIELEKRDFAGRPDYHKMYQTFVNTRQFATAHKFSQAHPDVGLTPFPTYRDEAENVGKSTPTVLVVSTTKRELIRRPVNLNKTAQVVILTDPNCHFCKNFGRALQSRPRLHAVLQKYSLWVTPPGTELEFASLQKWNKTHPDRLISIMYSLQGWPMIKYLGTPEFFFLRQGKLVAKHVGWHGEKDFAALEAELKKIGLWK
jgi:hypothetical protein